MVFELFWQNAVVFVGSFLVTWFGSGMVVGEVIRLARSLRLSYFTLSFFLLGLLTSLPELTIGINSVIVSEPGIFVGNLIGANLVLFLLVIPILAITGGGITYPKGFSKTSFIYTLIVIIAPTLLVSDRRVSQWEGVLLVLLYASLFLLLNKKLNFFESLTARHSKPNKKIASILFKITVGLVLLVTSSRQIVISTEYFSQLFQWSPFVVSLLLVSLGSNIPEISLVIRSVMAKRVDVAFADYLGSAAANTVIFGSLAVVYGATIVLPNHFVQRFIFLFVGLVLFYVFTKSKHQLSRSEGLVLLLLYVGFLAAELTIEKFFL